MARFDKKLLITSAASVILSSLIKKRRMKRKRNRSCWVRYWLSDERRNRFGAYHALMKELEREDPKSLKNFIRMDKTTFVELLEKVSPLIIKKDTTMRPAISPGEKLALTLRYLASGRHMIFC